MPDSENKMQANHSTNPTVPTDFLENPIWDSMQEWLKEYNKKKDRDTNGRFKKKEVKDSESQHPSE